MDYIKLQFPVIRYHDPVLSPTGTLETIQEAWLDSPTSIWGSHDGNDSNRHGGRGLSRHTDFPSKAHCLPGGVLDSVGRHYPILDLDAPEQPPSGLNRVVWFARLAVFGPFEYRFSFGKLEMLDLESYKRKVIDLNKAERRTYKFWRKAEKATSYREVLTPFIPPDIFDHYYEEVRVRNWVAT